MENIENKEIIKSYEGYNISFNKNKSVMVNATEMAKAFNKQPIDWLKTQPAQEYIEAYSKLKKISLADLQQVTRGGNHPGTWLHQDIALEFARWLSPSFSIWCNDQIKELLTTGKVSFNVPQTFADALQLAADQQRQIEKQQKLIAEQAPKAAYFDGLVDRKLLTNFRDTAKELGLKQNDFIQHLLDDKYVYRDSRKKIKPYAEYTNSYFEIKEYKTGDHAGNQTLVTPKGRETFRLLYSQK